MSLSWCTICHCANCAFPPVISWHLIDVFPFYKQRIKDQVSFQTQSPCLLRWRSPRSTAQFLWDSYTPRWRSGGYLQHVWPCGPSQGIVVYPPEVLIVLQDSVESNINSLHLYFRITLFWFLLPAYFLSILSPSPAAAVAVSGSSFSCDLSLRWCHQTIIIYT